MTRAAVASPDALALASAGDNLILRNLPRGAVFVFDHDLRYLSVGGRGLPDMGLSPSHLEGKTLFDVVGVDVEALEPLYRQALAGIESRLETSRNGATYLMRFGPVRDADGKIIAGIVVGQDITAFNLSDQEQRESGERFRIAFEHAPLPMALIGLDGRCEQVNAALCELSGYTEQQLQDRSVDEMTHPDDRAADAVLLRRLLDGELTTTRVEKRLLAAHGQTIWVDRSAWLVRRGDGTPLHVVAQLQDISLRKETERVLTEERRRLHEAQSIGRVGSWSRDLATSVTTWSDTLYELYGLDRLHFEVSPARSLTCLHPDDRDRVSAAITDCAFTGRPAHSRYRVIRANDGELRWFDGRVEGVFEEGRLVRIGGSVADVTDLLAEAEVRAAHAFQQAVFSASPDTIIVYDLEARATVWTNRSLGGMLGRAPAGRPGEAQADIMLEDLLTAADPQGWQAALLAAAAAGDGEAILMNHRLTGATGGTLAFCLSLTPFRRDDGGRVTQVVGVMRDTTEALAAEERLEYAALHDDLTDLPNRRLVTDRLAHLLLGLDEEGEAVVLFCDLDGFKRVNDTQGHHGGDAVLIDVARRMVEATRADDTVGRMGGDEFVVLCHVPLGADAAAIADRVARRIEKAVAAPISFDGTEHQITTSVGIYVASRGDEAGAALRNADAAMYLAKSRGKNGHATFQATLYTEAIDRGGIERQIRSALRHQTIEIYYQPIVEPSTGRVRGVEALLRVPDGLGGHLHTLDVISVAEHTGIVSAVDQYVLERACAQVAKWRRDPAHADLSVAVNRSAAEIARPGFCGRVTDVLATTGLDPEALTIEITETVVLEVTAHTITDLRRLRALGIGIAIDDFGTGYASLRYLATLPINFLKVDRSFTAGLPDDPACTTIVRATVGLADDLGMTCIVEGVETVQQLAALPDRPGLRVQGYLYSRPHPFEDGLPAYLDPTPPG
jgi:diguanylate cyclase (GGDEF)-like protein/PAS domain S-box-containing protein